MKYGVLLYLIGFSLPVQAQDNGRSIHAAGEQRRLMVNSPAIESAESESMSPFFRDVWLPSTLVFANGKVQAGLPVKLNLFENTIHYLDADGNENISNNQFNEVVLADTSHQKMHRFINGAVIKASGVERGWYELLQAGNVALYKKTIKTLPRSMSQVSEDGIKPLETSVQFFVLIKGKLAGIKRGKDIPALMEGHKVELQEYIKSKKLNGKSEAELIEIIRYYNSL